VNETMFEINVVSRSLRPKLSMFLLYWALNRVPYSNNVFTPWVTETRVLHEMGLIRKKDKNVKCSFNRTIRSFLVCYSVAYICSCCLVKPDAVGVSSFSSACLLRVLFTKECRMLWILASFVWNIGILVAEVGLVGGSVVIRCN